MIDVNEDDFKVYPNHETNKPSDHFIKLINTNLKSMSKVKDDQGKLRYDLVPFDALDEIAQVLTYGSYKYPDEAEANWRANSKPEDIPRYEAALLRHYSELAQGRTHDAESGLHHMAHVATNSLFIIALLKKFDKWENQNGCIR